MPPPGATSDALPGATDVIRPGPTFFILILTGVHASKSSHYLAKYTEV